MNMLLIAQVSSKDSNKLVLLLSIARALVTGSRFEGSAKLFLDLIRSTGLLLINSFMHISF